MITSNMISGDWQQHLLRRIAEPLPGWDAQRRMAPRPGEERSRLPTETTGVKLSAVLALLAPDASGQPTVLLTLRSEGLNSHKGQLSFPGGRIESGEAPAATALRETEEEVGIARTSVQLLGPMSSLYIPPSRSVVHAHVGIATNQLALRLQPTEVAEAFWLPLATLIDESKLKSTTRELLGHPVEVPYWDVHPATPLWGATAMMLAELLALFESVEAP
jgi:8-oxo-dGTP pyrophosphatase MutT (NUDIX family)